MKVFWHVLDEIYPFCSVYLALTEYAWFAAHPVVTAIVVVTTFERAVKNAMWRPDP